MVPVKESVSCSPSVGVAVAVEGENSGGSAEQRDRYLRHCRTECKFELCMLPLTMCAVLCVRTDKQVLVN